LEITSTGGLPSRFSKEKFLSGVSAPRNKELMRVFRDLELVEYLGSGVPRILKAYGPSIFGFSENFLRITLPSAETERIEQETTPTEGVNEGVNGGGRLVHDFILAHGGCRLPHIARGTGLPEKTIERHIRLPRERGDVEFLGAPKTGGYYTKAGEE